MTTYGDANLEKSTGRRSILITGCSSGIGLACAKGLQARGWQVFAGARQADDLHRLAQLGLSPIELDVTNQAHIERACDHVLNITQGRLDALFNNAGFGQPGAVEDLPIAAVRRQFETNLFGPIALTNRLLPVMRRQGFGRIIWNSSVLGFAAMPYRGAYNASKFAMEGWVDTLRLELTGSHIHVSLIEPGPILSRFREHAYQAFLDHIDRDQSFHRAVYLEMEARLTKPGATTGFTLPAEAILPPLIHALESPRPKARYRVTKPTQWFAIAKRILPTRWLDKLLLAATGGERPPTAR
ncbi:NAD(P)-dependent dehydrogenase (short-subunit alcohol dehydrogenase family) [Chitinivorax tropicus]|uniref:NAD(P)-dependent dehydrogenase (Short-subunit alcohol dehydrogenase family) n=1 Tax=Chitinivorax tropicus TaxID=714531 RepID=A0A840MUT5_9PROT|nr:SDR family NAD(P)-dependent oxidoreductase [Chitinivorax tropicus]MBB5020116.1 NAD(P)-dependent dehydrogenase (short-subunit alcohol dehydrogenase family) [Chitinivorax tropicus]